MTSSMAGASTGRAPLADPTFQAFTVLRAGFTVAPLLFGLDKFLGLMVDWPSYLLPGVANVLPGSPEAIMAAIGVIEIAAGVLVALRPRIGGLVVAAWLALVIVNLLLLGDHLDVALRDLGLLLGAVALSRLAVSVSRGTATGGPDAG